MYGSTATLARNLISSMKVWRRVISLREPMAEYGSGICGSRVWHLLTSPILTLTSGIRISWKYCLIWVLTALRQTLVRESLLRMLFTSMALTRRRCTTTIPIFTINVFMSCWSAREEKDRLFSSHVLQLLAVRSSRYTGAVTAGQIMNPWKKAFVAACLC